MLNNDYLRPCADDIRDEIAGMTARRESEKALFRKEHYVEKIE